MTHLSILHTRHRGFSLVELVVVMILLGIMSAVVMGRMLRSDSYDAIIVRDQVISLSRVAQQHALGRTDVALVVEPAGSDLSIRVESGDSSARRVIQQAEVARSQVRLGADVNQTASCALTSAGESLEAGRRLKLDFDALGNIVDGTVGLASASSTPISHGARLCINDAVALSVCWSPSGYAYVGDCID